MQKRNFLMRSILHYWTESKQKNVQTYDMFQLFLSSLFTYIWTAYLYRQFFILFAANKQNMASRTAGWLLKSN